MTIEMAEIMMRSKSMRPRAQRLLNAVLPHAIALETIELERDILALLEVFNNKENNDPAWKTFFHNITVSAKNRFKKDSKKSDDDDSSEEKENGQAPDVKKPKKETAE